MPTTSIQLTQPWADALAGYLLAEACKGRSATTISSRRSAIRVMARSLMAAGHDDPSTVTRKDMVSYMIARQAVMGVASVTTHHANCTSFWSWLSTEEEVANPMLKVARPRGGTVQPPDVISDEDFTRLVAACAGNSDESVRNRAMLLVMGTSGIRRAEVAALAIGDIDLASQTIIIRCGKGAKFRTSTISRSATLAMSKWLRRRSKLSTHGDAVFTSLSHGGQLTPSGISQIISSVGKAAGVPVHPHQLRHRYVDHYLAGGGQEHDLCHQLGWSSTAMVARYAAATASERAVVASRALADRMG